MTKEITKAFIIRQMEDKFGMREFVPTPFLFDETVCPVYNIEPHLLKRETVSVTKSITSATGFSLMSVPATERWKLYGYTVIFMASGAYKVAGVYIAHRPAGSIFHYLDLTKNQTLSYAVNLPVPLTLDPGNTINVNIDDYTSTADLQVNMDLTKEELR